MSTDKDGDGFRAGADVPITVRDPDDNDANVKPSATAQLGGGYIPGMYGESEPYASVSSIGETTADFTKAFEAAFGATAPKKLMAQFSSELRNLQAGRTTAKVKGKSGTDIVTQGVSGQERENILNKYLNMYAVSLTDAAQNGDVKAAAALQKGNFGLTLTTLKKSYADNGIPFNQKALMTTAIDSTLRPEKLNANLNLINLQAKTYFPALADRIDKGYTVKQLLSPYINTRANVLEEDPEMVDLKSLQAVAKDPKNLMNLYDYEVSLRQDPKWRFTKNAQDSMSSVASGIAKMFGLVG